MTNDVRQYIENLALELGYTFSNDKDAEISYIKSQAGHDIADENNNRQEFGKPLLTRDEENAYYAIAIKESFSFFKTLNLIMYLK